MLDIRAIAEADWPDLATRFRDFGFEQSLAYSRAAARRIGARCAFVEVRRDGVAVAAAAARIKPLPLLGRGIAWIPAGPLMLPVDGPAPDAALTGDILWALRRHFAEGAGHVLRLRLPGTALHDPAGVRAIAAGAGFTPTGRAAAYHSTAIDLSRDADQLMQQFQGKWRTDLRFALKSDLKLDHGDDAAMRARFLALFRSVQAAKGFAPDITPEFHFALADANPAGPDYRLDILIATKDGADLAGIVTGASGRNAVYLFGATAEAGRGLRAGYFLTWEGIALARSRGQDWYDMGGIDHAANPDVARFKDRMNGSAILTEPFEARPGGPVGGPAGALIGAVERLHARLKRR